MNAKVKDPQKVKIVIVILAFIIVCEFFGILFISLHNNTTNSAAGTKSEDASYGPFDDNEGPPGQYEVYPRVMFHGTTYYWVHMAGPVDKLPKGELPKGYLYAGDITHIISKVPSKNLQMVSTFDAEGKLYYNSQKPDEVCACMTTYWFDNAYVIFSKEAPPGVHPEALK